MKDGAGRIMGMDLYAAPIDSSPRRSLKSEKGHNNSSWKKEKYNKKGIK
jgi:hypothetical protein